MKATVLDYSLSLDNWTLDAAPLNKALSTQDAPMPQGLTAVIPALVQDTLLQCGVIADPLIGEQCFDAEWVEKRRWIYRTTFAASALDDAAERAELVFEGLDGEATILLNGEQIAQHRNRYRPCVVDVSTLLRAEGNTLEVHLELGVDKGPAEDSRLPDGVAFSTEESLGFRTRRGEPWRIFQRKPAYGFGWDWCPRVATIGIVDKVYVRFSRQSRVENLICSTLSQSPEKAEIQVSVELEGLHYYASTTALLAVEVHAPDGQMVASHSQNVLVRSGFNMVDVAFAIDQPQRWWPRGYGSQPLYTVSARLCDAKGQILSQRACQMGIRTLALVDADTFHFEINGVRIFCQGGNWVPPDVIYTRPSDAQYEQLVRLSAEANLNMLRVWGGGNYERAIFYEACDRMGLLVWQDFMFACSPYPDHEAWFREEVALEARYQVLRLASHAAFALWCGSNENSWAFCDWWGGKTRRGAHIYNDILPRAVRANAPHIPYWTGSPYGGANPNEQGIGNNHFWKEWGGTLCPDAEGRVDLGGHDACKSLFISEYGYQGPCSLRETRRYLGSDTVDRTSAVWVHHTNTRRYESNIAAGVAKLYGIDTATASNDAYLLYGGLWQGIAYGYSLDAARFREACSGAIMWMLNEAWGEAGWGIIDNALSRKIAWYFVRRALAAQRLILRRNAAGQGVLKLFAEKGTGERCSYKIFAQSPGQSACLLHAGELAIGGMHTTLERFDLASIPAQTLVWAEASVAGQTLEPVLLWRGDVRQWLDHAAEVRISPIVCAQTGMLEAVEVAAVGYVHAFHLMLADEPVYCVDNFADVLPGHTRTFTVAAKNVKTSDVCAIWLGKDAKIMAQPLAAL